MPRDKAARSRHASRNAHLSWANTDDPSTRLAPAHRAANVDRFENAVDRDGSIRQAIADARAAGQIKLADDLAANLARRAGHLRKAYMHDLAVASAKARAARKASAA